MDIECGLNMVLCLFAMQFFYNILCTIYPSLNGYIASCVLVYVGVSGRGNEATSAASVP